MLWFFQGVIGHQLAVYDVGSSVFNDIFKAFAIIPCETPVHNSHLAQSSSSQGRFSPQVANKPHRPGPGPREVGNEPVACC